MRNLRAWKELEEKLEHLTFPDSFRNWINDFMFITFFNDKVREALALEREVVRFSVTQAGGFFLKPITFICLLEMDYETSVVFSFLLEGFMTVKLNHIPLLHIDILLVSRRVRSRLKCHERSACEGEVEVKFDDDFPYRRRPIWLLIYRRLVLSSD